MKKSYHSTAQRAAARFAIALEPDACPAGFRLNVACDAAFDNWAALKDVGG